MKIFLTTPMSIEIGDAVVDEAALGSPQGRLALAFMVLERHRCILRDELAGVLWSGTLPSSWQGALRGLLSKVRGAFAAAGLSPADVLTSAFGCYQLHLPHDAVVDVEDAAAAAATAERALAVGEPDVARRYASSARDLATRPFLPAQGGDWVEQVRADLRGTLLRALEALSGAEAALGETGAAVAAAEEAIAIEPFRESAHRSLMAAYAAAGSRGQALRAYERCRRLLGEELGVAPSAETDAAYVALLGDEPEAPTPGELRSAGPPLPDPPPGLGLVGRDEERRQLFAAWERAGGRRRQLALVAAEAGMGKTSFALDLGDRVTGAGGMALYGRCDRELWTPYQPFPEVVERYAATCTPEELCRRTGWAAPELVRLFPELSASLGMPPAPAPATADPSGERHRMFSAIASLLAAAAAAQPVLLIVDDVHWAGPGTLLLLRHLSRALERSALMIMATYRPHEARDNDALVDTLADLGGEPGVTHLELPSLEVAAVGELARRAGRDEWAASAAELWEETGGNPFFVTELLSHSPQWRPTGGQTGPVDAAPWTTAPISVPRRIRDAVAGRRSRLSSDTNRVLEVAAVIGSQFEVSVLEQVAGLGVDAVLDALDEAAAARLVDEHDGEVEQYRFVEPLVRDVIYEQTGATRRCRLHAAIGEALERLGAVTSPEGVMALAHHFAKAGRLAPRGKALDHTVHAGDLALARLAYERAAEFYERALGLGLAAAAEAPRRCRVLTALAEARRKAGQVGTARETYLEAIRLARELDDPEALATCALGLSAGGRGISAWVADEVRVSMLEEALAALGPDRPEWRAKVDAELAKALYFSDQHDRADALVQEALALAREVGDHRVLAAAVSATRVLRWGPGNTELRLAYGEDLIGLGQAAGDSELVVRARLGRLADLLEVAERATVDVEVDTATSLADRLGQPYYRWRARAWGAALAVVDGRLGEAEHAARDAVAVWGSEAHPDASAWATVHHTVVALLRGRAAEAAEPLRELAEAYPMVPAYCCLLALVHAVAGERADAWLELERFAADGFTDPPFDTQWLFGVAVLAETCARLGDSARAQTLLELLLPFSGRLVVLDAFGGGVFWGPVSHQLGLLAATVGRPEEAQRHFADAIDVARRTGARLWVSRAHKASAGTPTAVPT